MTKKSALLAFIGTASLLALVATQARAKDGDLVDENTKLVDEKTPIKDLAEGTRLVFIHNSSLLMKSGETYRQNVNGYEQPIEAACRVEMSFSPTLAGDLDERKRKACERTYFEGVPGEDFNYHQLIVTHIGESTEDGWRPIQFTTGSNSFEGPRYVFMSCTYFSNSPITGRVNSDVDLSVFDLRAAFHNLFIVAQPDAPKK